jgi:hypothetical protein
LSTPTAFDVLDHHPYALTPTVPARAPGDVSVPDLWKIWRILRAAERAGHALPAQPKSLWVTEIDWRTDPPTPQLVVDQTRYLGLAFYEFWRQGVSRVCWYGLRDPAPGNERQIFPGSGLYYLNGTPKPSVNAFRFPSLRFAVAEQPYGCGARPLDRVRS